MRGAGIEPDIEHIIDLVPACRVVEEIADLGGEPAFDAFFADLGEDFLIHGGRFGFAALRPCAVRLSH